MKPNPKQKIRNNSEKKKSNQNLLDHKNEKKINSEKI